uniref:Zinc finger, MYND-type containing 12 n=1 Tax=Sinocyclocheilus anshuiensis TaxID=1608454 RepID=A0A671LUE7_9TELE
MSATINLLANTKGVKKLCELCQKPAKRQCKKCLVTFYCIHEKVCPLLVSIDAPASFGTLQSDREHHHKETGLYAMRVYGSCAAELVPAYLLRAQANIGLGSLSQAHEYLSKAEWTVMKTPGCSHTVLHQLHRTLGCLHAATGKYTSALTHFANDVYYASEMFGLGSTVMSGGYFLMADVFLKQNKPGIAHSLYTEVANSWHAHLCKLIDGISRSGTQPECFDEAQCVETDQMLRCILEFEEQCVKPRPDQSPCWLILWLLCNNYTKALDYGKKAEVLIQGLNEQNTLSESVHNLLQHAEKHLE